MEPNLKPYPQSQSQETTQKIEPQIVPWMNRLEWEKACDYFNSDNHKDLMIEISVWKQRVLSLPIGVEATLFLVQAELEDNRLKGFSKNTTEDTIRSLYSLAIIRFLNHVSHLATREMGGTASLSMFKLVAQVDIPEWIVNLRHEASHGVALPSIETLRLAARFIKEWLMKNYWLPPNSESSRSEGPAHFVRSTEESQQDSNVILKITTHLSAFIACRVYKLRGNNEIIDRDILQLVPEQSHPAKAKAVTLILKGKLANFMKNDGFAFCAAAAELMLPQKDFCVELMSLFDIQDFFPKLVMIWNPMLELLEKKSKLISMCSHLANIHTLENTGDHIQNVSALWLDRLLEMLELSGRKVSQKLLPVLREVMRMPNAHSGIFLERLLRLVERNIGLEKINQLSILASIWTQDKTHSGRIRKKRFKGKISNNYFTVGSLTQSVKGTNQDPLGLTVANKDVENWEHDPRGGINFWRRLPCGVLLNCI